MMLKGHEVGNRAVPQDTASIKPVVHSPKLTNVILREAVDKRGCHVVCFVHGVVQVICRMLGPHCWNDGDMETLQELTNVFGGVVYSFHFHK